MGIISAQWLLSNGCFSKATFSFIARACNFSIITIQLVIQFKIMICLLREVSFWSLENLTALPPLKRFWLVLNEIKQTHSNQCQLFWEPETEKKLFMHATFSKQNRSSFWLFSKISKERSLELSLNDSFWTVWASSSFQHSNPIGWPYWADYWRAWKPSEFCWFSLSWLCQGLW